MFALIPDGKMFSFKSRTKLLQVVIELQLNRKSASLALPTRLTGRILTVLQKSGLTHHVFFCQKKKRFPS